MNQHHPPADTGENTRKTQRLQEDAGELFRNHGEPIGRYVGGLEAQLAGDALLTVLPAYLRAAAFLIGWLLIGNAIALAFDAPTWVYLLVSGILVIALAPSGPQDEDDDRA